MKKIFIVTLMLPGLAWAADRQPTREEFEAMDCTQAVAWSAGEIRKVADDLRIEVEDGDLETMAIRMLSQLPDSPCYRGHLMHRGQK